VTAIFGQFLTIISITGTIFFMIHYTQDNQQHKRPVTVLTIYVE